MSGMFSSECSQRLETVAVVLWLYLQSVYIWTQDCDQ